MLQFCLLKTNTKGKTVNKQDFWEKRSQKYNNLKWVNETGYLDYIIQLANLKQTDHVLDVGCGTGAVSRAVEPLVKQVFGMDISSSMLEHGVKPDVKFAWNITKEVPIFDYFFDKIIARMVFHHVLTDIDKAFKNCYDMLKPKGLLLVAESVPPTDDVEVVDWFTYVRKLKEDRRTFRSTDIKLFMEETGFDKVKTYDYIRPKEKCSTVNWLENSGLKPSIQKDIMYMHRNASSKIKEAYKMEITDTDVICENKNVITVGFKK